MIKPRKFGEFCISKRSKQDTDPHGMARCTWQYCTLITKRQNELYSETWYTIFWEFPSQVYPKKSLQNLLYSSFCLLVCACGNYLLVHKSLVSDICIASSSTTQTPSNGLFTTKSPRAFSMEATSSLPLLSLPSQLSRACKNAHFPFTSNGGHTHMMSNLIDYYGNFAGNLSTYSNFYPLMLLPLHQNFEVLLGQYQ